jgi:transcriptional regulator with XRE-family HTH domain
MDAFATIVEDHLRHCLGEGADLGQVRKGIWDRFVGGVAHKCWLKAIGSLYRSLVQRGFTQKEIAQYLGIDRTVFNKVLSGKVELSFRTVALVLTALNLDLAAVDFPPREERLTAGFLAAVPYVRWDVLHEQRSDPVPDPFTEEKLGHLGHFFGGGPPPRPGSGPGRPPNGQAGPGPDDVVAGWGAAWLVCVWAFRPALKKELLRVLQAIDAGAE